MLCEMVKSLYYKQKTSRVSRKFHESMTVLKNKMQNSSYRKQNYIQHPRFTEFTFMKLFAANRETFGPMSRKSFMKWGELMLHFHETLFHIVCTQYVQ
jgi:hypothetical protein